VSDATLYAREICQLSADNESLQMLRS